MTASVRPSAASSWASWRAANAAMPDEPPTSSASSRASRRVKANESRVGDLDDPVGDRAVVGLGPEVLADALDEVGPAGAAGVDRAGRVGADDLDLGVLLLEVAADAADGAAGAHAGHEVGDLAVGLRPDLRAGGLVVRARVVRVGVLVRLPRARLRGELVGDVVVGVRVLRRDRGRADDHLGAVRLEHVALVLADLVGADEDALVAAGPGRPSPARRRCCRRSAPRSCRRAGARRRPRRRRSSGWRCGPSRSRRG